MFACSYWYPVQLLWHEMALKVYLMTILTYNLLNIVKIVTTTAPQEEGVV